MTFSTSVYYSDSLEGKTSTSTSLHVVPNATFTLRVSGTTTPAIIYSDSNFTVLNSAGTITTDSTGQWWAWLDRGNLYDIYYRGKVVRTFNPSPGSEETQSEIADHAAQTSGVHGSASGDDLATESFVNTQIASAASGGATPDATSGVKGKLVLAGDLAGTASAPAIATGLRNLITNAVQTSQVGAVSGVAGLDGSGKVPSAQLPSGSTPDATSGANGVVRLAGDLAGTGGTAAAPKISDTLRTQITNSVQTSSVGATNGVASLDSGGKLPTAQLPASGTFSGNFAGSAASNYKETWISKSAAFTPALTESGCIYSCNTGTTTGFTAQLPYNATPGTVYTFQLSNTAPLTFALQSGGSGGYTVFPTGTGLRQTVQNTFVTWHCVAGTGLNAGWIVDGPTVA